LPYIVTCKGTAGRAP